MEYMKGFLVALLLRTVWARDNLIDATHNEVLRYPDGSVYNGQTLSGKKHGIGLFQTTNGTFYYGNWKMDEKHGSGTLILPDGSTYHGQWLHDRKHGWGISEERDGTIYEGQHVNDLKHGKGRLYSIDGSRYDDEWVLGSTRNGEQAMPTVNSIDHRSWIFANPQIFHPHYISSDMLFPKVITVQLVFIIILLYCGYCRQQ